MNPCPCGHAGDPRRACQCTGGQVHAYKARVSGPLLDRIDLRVDVSALSFADLAGPPGEASQGVARRVLAARRLQTDRSGRLNADLDSASVRRLADPDDAGRALLEAAVDRLGVTGRGHDRLLRVARTLADLDAESRVLGRHVAEALQFRHATPSPI
jgi:magnesium chelatase family protein